MNQNPDLENNDEFIRQTNEFIRYHQLLNNLHYDQLEEISNLEKQIYTALKQNTENVVGLIVLMQEQIMVGNQSRAKALAYKIWEIGGKLTPLIENLYICNLINIGLLEMAGILLKNRMDNMANNFENFYSTILKYSIATGDMFLLEKIVKLSANPSERQKIAEFINVNKNLNYVSHFQNIQKLIYDKTKDFMLSYEFNLYNDRGFTDLEIVLYVNDDTADINQFFENLEMQIISYCATKKINRLNNVCFLVRRITKHLAESLKN